MARRRARRDLRPRRLPARERARDDPAADARRERARADRPGRGARALRRRPGAGARPHRAARRPVRQAARRARDRAEEGGGDPRAVRRRSRRRSPTAASPRRRRTCGSSGESRRWTPPPPFLPSQKHPRRGRRRPPSSNGSASAASRRAWGNCRRPDASRVRAAASDGRPPGASRAARGAARAPARLERGPRRHDGGAAVCHTAEHVDLIRYVEDGLWLDGDTRLHRDHLRGRGARGGNRDRGGAAGWLRPRPPAGSPRLGRARDGVLRVQQRRGGRAGGAVPPRARAGRDRRLRRASRQRHGGDLPRRRQRPLRLAPPMAVLPGQRRPGRPGRDDAQRPAARAVAGDEEYLEAFDRRSSSPRSSDSSPSSCSSPQASTRTTRTRSRTCVSPRTASASSPAAAGRLSDRVAAVLEGGYDLETLPDLVDAALEGFTS